MPVLRKSPQVSVEFARSFLEQLQALDTKARVILFGSRARRTHTHYSDYDLLILSDLFQGMTDFERYALVMGLVSSRPEIEIQPVCLTHTEWPQKQTSLLGQEILRDGLPLSSFM
ncbi:MAG: nucleotidyltransferase domain-containing protein [Spirochaetales bacterium]|nr:nucleotidyltransferase domain-containing protein [Spirochaetales bacterium]